MHKGRHAREQREVQRVVPVGKRVLKESRFVQPRQILCRLQIVIEIVLSQPQGKIVGAQQRGEDPGTARQNKQRHHKIQMAQETWKLLFFDGRG